MTIEQIKQSLDKKGIYFCLMEAWKSVWPIRWVREKYITDQIYEERAYRYLKKKYLPLLFHFSPTQNEVSSNDNTKRIWVCWLQGEENAPKIVKKCIQSFREFAGGHEVCLITNDNISNYIEIPTIIKKKLQQKRMQYATYSDYIRTSLLEKHGGVWIDATVLLTAEIPKEVFDAPLFCFQKSVLSRSPIAMSSWFLSSMPHHRILQQTKFLFEQYWERENHLCNYYLFHLFFSLVADYDDTNRIAFQQMPYYNNVDVHVLSHKLTSPYSESEFARICNNAFAHKLTYKFQDKKILKKDNTFYNFIINK